MDEVGEWIGQNVFGDVVKAIGENKREPATIILISVPEKAQELLFFPLELALLQGKPLAEQGIRFIYQTEDARAARTVKPSKPPLITRIFLPLNFSLSLSSRTRG